MTNLGDLHRDEPITHAGLASPPLRPHLLMEASVRYAGVAGSGTGPCRMDDDGAPRGIASDAPQSTRVIRWDPARYAVEGAVTRWRVEHDLLANGVNPNMDIDVGVYPVTAGAGAANTVRPVLGARLGTHRITPRPTAGQVKTASATIDAPAAAGFYTFGIESSAVVAATVYVVVMARLQVVWE